MQLKTALIIGMMTQKLSQLSNVPSAQRTYMQSLSLAQLFGEGAFQDTSVLIIQKTDLLRLTLAANNTAESLLVGILITALNNFQGVITDEDSEPITDENNQPITYDNSEAFEFLQMISWKAFFSTLDNQRYINHQIIVNIYTQL
ncbi:hypothetical protein LC653_45845 [Nostoc sp. CHAB 5784]|uniref:hypothetical protein n=1 Tax=Nostoc mirabile TaxID=2907820 RepID=UPI001E4604CD|nr:hypothetical protein [Nostoc mirabile]MCC5670883.1 hypothetical protein [Nostoc mirabile CHAB5784]